MTMMGSEFWPRTAEGRVPCVLLAFYAFGVLGDVTAALASFFVGRESTEHQVRPASTEQVGHLTLVVAALRTQLSEMALPRLPG